ncbi:MAG: acyl-CoA dehydrogenase family protein [Halioglobus sp.]
MDFSIPSEIAAFLDELDDFIEQQIAPLQARDDNQRFFDHRREDARTDWDRQGLPNADWEALLAEARQLAIAAGIYSYPFPAEHGGRDGSNLGMAIIREHLAAKGLGLHNDLQNEHSIVGNNVGLLLMLEYGSEAQRAEWLDDLKNARAGFAVAITEPEHGPMPRTCRRAPPAPVTTGSSTAKNLEHRRAHGQGRPGDGAHLRRGR